MRNKMSEMKGKCKNSQSYLIKGMICLASSELASDYITVDTTNKSIEVGVEE